MEQLDSGQGSAVRVWLGWWPWGWSHPCVFMSSRDAETKTDYWTCRTTTLPPRTEEGQVCPWVVNVHFWVWNHMEWLSRGSQRWGMEIMGCEDHCYDHLQIGEVSWTMTGDHLERAPLFGTPSRDSTHCEAQIEYRFFVSGNKWHIQLLVWPCFCSIIMCS